MTRTIFVFIAIALLFCLTPARGQRQRGKATYYSKRATGARTASGERLHHDSMTCAHRTYPFGTRLKVTNPANGTSVVVRVTDRGPFIKGRIIDLSWAAAKALGILTQGVVSVVVEKIDDITIPLRAESQSVVLPEVDFDIHNGAQTFFEEVSSKTWRDMRNTDSRYSSPAHQSVELKKQIPSR